MSLGSVSGNKKWTEEDWKYKAKECGYVEVNFFDDMSRVEAVGSCGHRIDIKMGGFKKKLQKSVSTCRNCTTQANRDFTEYKIRTLLKKYNCEFRAYSPESRFCDLKYSCGHDGRETYSSLQVKSKKHKAIKCTECIMKDFASSGAARESKCESDLLFFIKSISDKTKTNYRRSYPYGLELDILDLNSMVGFEMNGMYWHSEDAGKKASYHISKTRDFNRDNIDVVHIFEYEWETKRDIIQSIIRKKTNRSLMSVRKYQLEEVSFEDAKAFMKNHHISSSSGMTSFFNIAAKNSDGEIIGVCSLKRNSGKEIQIYKIAEFINIEVVDFEKMCLRFISENTSFLKVVMFADARFVSPDHLKNIGFTIEHYTSPDKLYYKGVRILLSRVDYSVPNIHKHLGKYNQSMSVDDNLKENGFRVIYDCGKIKGYIYL